MWGLWNNDIHRSVRLMVKLLCAAGANPNAVDFKGQTPLHDFAGAGPNSTTAGPCPETSDQVAHTLINRLYESFLHALIKEGADINAKDDTGKTPLHLAVRQGEPVLCNLLLKLGVNALITKDNGMRPSQVNGKNTTRGPLTLRSGNMNSDRIRNIECGINGSRFCGVRPENTR